MNRLNLLVISGNNNIHLKKYLDGFNPEIVVIDSSVPGYFIKYLQNVCDTSGINCNSVKEKVHLQII
jgi:hypothetical protein